MILRRQIYVVFAARGEGRGSGATATGAGCGLRWDGPGGRAARIGGMESPDAAGLGASLYNEYGPRWPHQCQTSGSSAEGCRWSNKRHCGRLVEAGPDSGEAWRGPLAMRGLAACPGSPVRRRSVDSGDWSPAQSGLASSHISGPAPLHPAQDAQAIAAFKKKTSPLWSQRL